MTESAMPRSVGASVDLTSQGLPPEFVLFGEDASRVVISCDRNHLSRIQQVAVKYGLSAEPIGETVADKVEIRLDGRVVVASAIGELREAYESALERSLKADVELVAAD